jgi:adenylate kinase
MILLMGLPGSGKGTQGKMLADHHGLHLISMGEIIRMYVTGDRRQRMLTGELLDDDEVIEILERVLDSLPDDSEYILDGFPRTVPQAEWLVKRLRAKSSKIRCVIHLTASAEAVKARLQARGRIDDKDEVIEERFREYQQLTQPLLKWYKEHDIAVCDIHAERSPHDVHEEIMKVLKVSDL